MFLLALSVCSHGGTVMVWWWWWCVGTPGPVKNCLFICSIGFINGSPTAHQSDLGLVP